MRIRSTNFSATALLSTTALIFVLGLAGCESSGITAREKGVLAGGAIGSGLGAIIGNQVGHSGAGIAIGGAAGALAGGLIGNSQNTTDRQMEEQEERLRRQEEELRRQRRELDDLRRSRGYSDSGSSHGDVSYRDRDPSPGDGAYRNQGTYRDQGAIERDRTLDSQSGDRAPSDRPSADSSPQDDFRY